MIVADEENNSLLRKKQQQTPSPLDGSKRKEDKHPDHEDEGEDAGENMDIEEEEIKVNQAYKGVTQN